MPYKSSRGDLFETYEEAMPRIDENIRGLIIYLNTRGCNTISSCGHVGTVDIEDQDIQECKRSMELLNLPLNSWRIHATSPGQPWGEGYRLEILGPRRKSRGMWTKVQKISNIAKSANPYVL